MAITLSSKTVPSVIVLKGDLRRRHEERRAGGTIRPGHLVKTSGANVVVHASAGGAAAAWFAKEDALYPDRDKTSAYASGDLVSIHMAQPGDRVLARVAASATAIANGDPLTSNGDGCLKKASGSDVVIADAAEAVDNSGGASETFIRADVR